MSLLKLMISPPSLNWYGGPVSRSLLFFPSCVGSIGRYIVLRICHRWRLSKRLALRYLCWVSLASLEGWRNRDWGVHYLVAWIGKALLRCEWHRWRSYHEADFWTEMATCAMKKRFWAHNQIKYVKTYFKLIGGSRSEQRTWSGSMAWRGPIVECSRMLFHKSDFILLWAYN